MIQITEEKVKVADGKLFSQIGVHPIYRNMTVDAFLKAIIGWRIVKSEFDESILDITIKNEKIEIDVSFEVLKSNDRLCFDNVFCVGSDNCILESGQVVSTLSAKEFFVIIGESFTCDEHYILEGDWEKSKNVEVYNFENKNYSIRQENGLITNVLMFF